MNRKRVTLDSRIHVLITSDMRRVIDDEAHRRNIRTQDLIRAVLAERFATQPEHSETYPQGMTPQG